MDGVLSFSQAFSYLFSSLFSSSQDLDAGVVVGVGNGRTYGKGLVQNVAELPYNNALKYTVAKYYTPSGRYVLFGAAENNAHCWLLSPEICCMFAAKHIDTTRSL